jgi:DNA polymerase III epsilon subunit-like protein
MSAALAFVDTETTGLDPDRHEVWEVGLILRDSEGVEVEYEWQLPVNLGRADAIALTIGHFYERHIFGFPLLQVHRTNIGTGDSTPDTLAGWAYEFAELTHGAHLVGAVPSFDDAFLKRLLRANGACPGWHYHLIDVEALAVGRLMLMAKNTAPHGTRGAEQAAKWTEVALPPWNSNDLSRAVGVDPDLFDRHTALGDARWAKAIYDAVMGS